MKLTALKLRNYRVIRRADIVLPSGVTGIIGPNGAGKTSIIEAIAWALYGTVAARSGKDEIRTETAGAGDACEVALEFELGSAPYRIIRRLVGAGGRAEAELYRGGHLESVGVADTGAYVTALIGLDWRGFLTSFLARQQELNALSDLTPGKRREHLVGMLGVDRLDKALDLIKADTKDNRTRTEMLERQTAARAELAEALEKHREHYKALETQVVVESGARSEQAATLGQLEELYKAEHDKQIACSQLQSRLQAVSESLATIDERSRGLLTEEKELKDLAIREAHLGAERDRFDQVRTELRELAEARQKMEMKASLARQVGQAEKEAKKNRDRRDELSQAFDQLQKERADLPADLDQLHQQASDNLESARREYTEKRAEVRSSEKDVAGLRERLRSLESLGGESVCDRCGRPLGDDLPEIEAHFTAELKRVEAELKGMQAELELVQKRGDALKREVEKLSGLKRQAFELDTKITALQVRLKEAERAIEVAENQLADRRAQVTELGTVVFEADRFATLTAESERLERNRRELDQIRGRLGRANAVASELTALAESRDRAVAEKADLDARLREMSFDDEAFAVLTERFAQARVDLEKAVKKETEVVKERDLAQRELELKQARLVEFDELEAQLEGTREAVYRGEKLKTIFGDFRRHIVAEIRPALATISGRLMGEMTDGRYSLIELDEQYNLRMSDGGAFYPIERFSGGEKDLANLCLRLAISQALTESAGMDSSFVILDEIFGSQDEGRRDLIFQAMAGLRQQFPQILLVTHIEEVKNRVDRLIEVRPTGSGHSEVLVDGVSS